MGLIALAEQGWIPDWLIRIGIRRLIAQRHRGFQNRDIEAHRRQVQELVESLKADELAVHTAKANEQHYETPPDFFRLALGPRLKYSCCLYEQPGASLAEAEEAMLALTCQRAELGDGQGVQNIVTAQYDVKDAVGHGHRLGLREDECVVFEIPQAELHIVDTVGHGVAAGVSQHSLIGHRGRDAAHGH